MTNVVRSNKTIEDRARFGLGSDTQDDNTEPADTETALTAEGVLELAAVIGASSIVVDSTALEGTSTTVQGVLEEKETAEISYRPKFSTLAVDSADVNASIVLVDSGLSVTLGVGTYVWEALLKVTTADAADIRIKPIATTATVTAATSFTALVSPIATVGIGQPEFVAWNTETTIVTGLNAAGAFLFKGTIVTTVGGVVKIQFAQGTSNASNTHIDSGSYMEAHRVA